jgi:hypothetical protein
VAHYDPGPQRVLLRVLGTRSLYATNFLLAVEVMQVSQFVLCRQDPVPSCVVRSPSR